MPSIQKPARRLIYLWNKTNLIEMEQDIAAFSRSFTTEHSKHPQSTLCGLLSSAWKYFRSMSLPSPGATAQYDDCHGGREEHTVKLSVLTRIKTGPASRVFRRPAGRNAKEHMMIMSTEWLPMEAKKRSYNPFSRTRNVTVLV